MTAISASFVAIKTMADGTVRLTVDLDCTLSAIAALNLMPGTPLAIARLTNEAGTAALQPEPEPEPAKGGALAQLAGRWCNEPQFQQWLRDKYGVKDVRNAEDAAQFVRAVCDVKSRAEFDHDDYAGTRFQNKIRLPYMAYCQGRNK
jgi:hypothetical protein